MPSMTSRMRRAMMSAESARTTVGTGIGKPRAFIQNTLSSVARSSLSHDRESNQPFLEYKTRLSGRSTLVSAESGCRRLEGCPAGAPPSSTPQASNISMWSGAVAATVVEVVMHMSGEAGRAAGVQRDVTPGERIVEVSGRNVNGRAALHNRAAPLELFEADVDAGLSNRPQRGVQALFHDERAPIAKLAPCQAKKGEIGASRIAIHRLRDDAQETLLAMRQPIGDDASRVLQCEPAGKVPPESQRKRREGLEEVECVPWGRVTFCLRGPLMDSSTSAALAALDGPTRAGRRQGMRSPPPALR